MSGREMLVVKLRWGLVYGVSNFFSFLLLSLNFSSVSFLPYQQLTNWVGLGFFCAFYSGHFSNPFSCFLLNLMFLVAHTFSFLDNHTAMPLAVLLTTFVLFTQVSSLYFLHHLDNFLPFFFWRIRSAIYLFCPSSAIAKSPCSVCLVRSRFHICAFFTFFITFLCLSWIFEKEYMMVGREGMG
ncbi:hypothetical protein DFH27DRAFT_167764 [Peziza echinospora]|nr:hypothetical protein DFH27DRAFT_167764 [Peziza echinospora]